MIYYGSNDYRDYIAHYGVLGMRWGVRRYQPYSYTEGRDGRRARKGKEIGIAKKLGGTAKKAGKKIAEVTKKGAKAVAKGAKNVMEERKRTKVQRLINSGSIAQIKANRGKVLTEKDVKDAIARMENDLRLEELDTKKKRRSIERGKEAIDMITNGVSSVVRLTETFKDVNKKVSDANFKKTTADKRKMIKDMIDNAKWDDLNKVAGDMTDEERKRAAQVRQWMNTWNNVGKGKNGGNDTDSNSDSSADDDDFEDVDIGAVKNNRKKHRK